jgi:hypothetical protein
MDNKFENVARPIDFGFQKNPNSWFKIANWQDATLPANFFLARRNADPTLAEMVKIQSLATGASFYHAGFDADLTPIAPWADLPPNKPLLTVSQPDADKMITITATAQDDKDTPSIEIFADWIKLGATCTSSGKSTTCTAKHSISQSNHPRKYAYIYARAFDKTAIYETKTSSVLSGTKEIQGTTIPYYNRAYSNVIELGPEVTRSRCSMVVGGSDWQFPLDLSRHGSTFG